MDGKKKHMYKDLLPDTVQKGYIYLKWNILWQTRAYIITMMQYTKQVITWLWINKKPVSLPMDLIILMTVEWTFGTQKTYQ